MIRILFASDQPVLAIGLLHVVSSTGGFEVRSVDNTLDAVIGGIEGQNPDVLLLDFTPEEHFAMVLELRQRAPDCRMILWSHRLSTEVAFQAMRLGVRGILRKTLGAELVLKCLGLVAAGDLWFDKDLTHAFLMARSVALTPRESQIVPLVAAGLKNKEIAAALSLSDSTVRIYLSALFHKLKVRDRYELAIYGLKNMPVRLESASQAAAPECGPTAPRVRFLVVNSEPLASRFTECPRIACRV